jgi:acetoin utilization protein AcuB
MMREHKVRHLPVLHGGKLVGLLSQRDLLLVETIKNVDPEVVTVQEAMTEDLMTTSPEEPLKTVVQEMSDRKIGSAVVFSEGKVIGIFTSTDALQAFSHFLKN